RLPVVHQRLEHGAGRADVVEHLHHLDLAVERLERLPTRDQLVVLALDGEGDRGGGGGRWWRFGVRLRGGGVGRGLGGSVGRRRIGVERGFVGDRLGRGRRGLCRGCGIAGRRGGGLVGRGGLAGGQQQRQRGGHQGETGDGAKVHWQVFPGA